MFRKLFFLLFISLSFTFIQAQNCNPLSAITGTRVSTLPTCTNVASMVPLFSGSSAGLVPPFEGGNTSYLRSDGTWATLPSFTYPASGIPNSTGTGWGSSYTTSGSGTQLSLTDSPVFTTGITSPLYVGQFGQTYGTMVLGNASGMRITKTVNDATPVVQASINTATTATGDYYGVVDASNTTHTVVDNSLGLHGTSATLGSTGQAVIDSNGDVSIGYTGASPIPWPLTLGTSGQFHCDASGNCRGATFNGIGLSTSQGAGDYLGGDGTYHVLPSGTNLLPLNNTWTGTNTFQNNLTVDAQGSATGGMNYDSYPLYFNGSFNDAGSTKESWEEILTLGSGTTPTSTLSISPIVGGTTGSHIFSVAADQSSIGGGGSQLTLSASGTSLTSTNSVVISVPSGGAVYSTGSFQGTKFTAGNGGSVINLNPPAGGINSFNQNLTAETGDINVCPTGTPGYTLGAGSGTGATASIQGNNCSGIITITTGQNPVAQSYFITINFSNPFTHYGFCNFNALRVTLQDANYNFSSVYIDTGNAGNFSIGSIGTMTLTGLSNHQWSYNCGGY